MSQYRYRTSRTLHSRFLLYCILIPQLLYLRAASNVPIFYYTCLTLGLPGPLFNARIFSVRSVIINLPLNYYRVQTCRDIGMLSQKILASK